MHWQREGLEMICRHDGGLPKNLLSKYVRVYVEWIFVFTWGLVFLKAEVVSPTRLRWRSTH